MQVLEKTTGNSEGLGRQTQPGFNPGTSRLPVLSVITLPLVGQGEGEHKWKQKSFKTTSLCEIKIWH